jgi:hypothetical protein
MKTSRTIGVVILGLGVTLSACSPHEQASAPTTPSEPAMPGHGGMEMPTNTLFLAHLDADQVVSKSNSSATGTGVFLVDPVQRTLQYRLTYDGLEAGGARSIALYNFAAGENGKAIAGLCGENNPCPRDRFGTISGRFALPAPSEPDDNIVSEFNSERVYVEIVGGDGRPEIRGQLAPNSAMVPIANFVADIAPLDRTGSKGSGTAVMSETYLPGGKVSVTYAVTVAGLSGPPTSIALAAGPSPKAERIPLQPLKTEYARAKPTGTLTATYQIDSTADDTPVLSRLRKKGYDKVGLVVMTKKFPGGEAFGVFEPVR